MQQTQRVWNRVDDVRQARAEGIYEPNWAEPTGSEKNLASAALN